MKKFTFLFLMLCIAATQSNAQNTTLGTSAGVPIPPSDENTHIGGFAGSISTTSVFGNTFVGSRSGELNTVGLRNTFLGQASGQSNDRGNGNTFLGTEAGVTNVIGNFNTFVGLEAGNSNTGGSDNSYFGHRANGDPMLTHASAIGANAYVCSDFTISIGANTDNTVIGDCQPRTNPFTGNFNRLSVAGGDFMVDDNYYITNPTLAPGGIAGLVQADLTGTLQPLSFTGNASQYLGGDGNWHAMASGLADHDWYQVGSSNPPTSINDDIWTDGTVYINWGMTPTPPFFGPNVRLYVNGAIQTSTSYIASDRRFKRNIQPIANSLDKIKRIQGVNYEFNQEAFAERRFPTGKTMGFLAQNLKEVVPELVKTADDGYMAVNYDGVVALLVEGLNEQQAMIERQEASQLQLQTEIDQLKAAIQSLCNEGCGNLMNKQALNQQEWPTYWEAIELKQNQPNPFRNSTVIPYYLPKEVSEATLMIYDLQGRQLKSYPIHASGQGTIEIEAGSLPSGMYLYHLLIDGKTSSTLKMILSDRLN
ncbi:MAG: tail fiber domain-containing protein [Bacteroidota bacterium]